MVNLAPVLSMLNTSLSAPTLGCWGQNPPNETQILPITYKGCKAAIQSIPVGEKGFAPITFAHSADAGFEVPESWQSGNCVVAIDVVGPNFRETSTFAAIVERAFDLAVECVITAPHFGGRSFLGKDEGLEVWLYGEDDGMRAKASI